MKKIYLLLLMALFTNLSLFSQNIVFEDANFKKALLNHNIDTNTDGEISKEEAKNFKGKLNLKGKNIKSLKELEYFINITELNCGYNQLTEVDVSKNVTLTHLWFNHNQLTKVDVSKNIALIDLGLNYNQLTKVDISKNTALTGLGVGNNRLKDVDVSKNTALVVFYAGTNQLTNLDVSRNTALTHLWVNSNKLTDLNVSKNTALTHLWSNRNELTSLGVSKNTALIKLYTGNNRLTDLDVSKNITLTILDVFSNQLTNLDVSKNTALIYLHIRNTQFKELDLSSCKLDELLIYDCPELTTLNLIDQQLNRLQVIKNPKLNIVCANLDKIDFIDSELKNNNNGNYKLSTDCTKETLNSITGKVTYAPNLDLCGTPNLEPVNQLRLIITSFNGGGRVKKTIIPDISGNYRTFVPMGNYVVGGQLFKPNYFDYSSKPNRDPSVNLISFIGAGETKTRDICVTPKNKLNDLAISVSGGRARPGFNVTYTLTYKNIGNTILSGAVNLKIKDLLKQEFISASTTPNEYTSTKLTWNFKDLAPFQTKTIYVTFKLNKPTDDPELNGGDILKYIATISDKNHVEKEETLGDNTAILCQEVRNSWDPNDKTCIEGSILRPKNVGKYLTYKIRFENKGSAEATNVRVEDVIDPTKFDLKSLRYISSGNHLCVTEVEGNIVNFNFKDINLGFSPSDNKGYVLFKIKTLESLKEGDEIKNKASIFFDFNKPVITETETVVVKKKVEKKLEFSDYYMLTPNPTKGPADLIEKKSGLKIRFFTINDSHGDMLAYDPGRTRHFDFWYLTTGKVYYLRVFTENNGILSTRFIKE